VSSIALMADCRSVRLERCPVTDSQQTVSAADLKHSEKLLPPLFPYIQASTFSIEDDLRKEDGLRANCPMALDRSWPHSV
jgi:hypothetical protein